MKITVIKYFFKFNKSNTKYYTFKQEEHEIVLLKKLDDNKISYNSQIYENDFFEYFELVVSDLKLLNKSKLEEALKQSISLLMQTTEFEVSERFKLKVTELQKVLEKQLT